MEENSETYLPIIINKQNTMYEVSNLGNIKNSNTQNILHHSITKKGYHLVKLYFGGGLHSSHSVHRLVALAFIENPENKPTVNHINGIKSNNAVSNLEWATFSEQELHAFKNDLNHKGENHPAAKLTDDIVRNICVMLQDNKSIPTISKSLNIAEYYMKPIINKHAWTHISQDYIINKETIYKEVGNRKINENIAIEICDLIMTGKYLTEIAIQMNVSVSIVKAIKSKKTWKKISENYDFKKIVRRKGNSV